MKPTTTPLAIPLMARARLPVASNTEFLENSALFDGFYYQYVSTAPSSKIQY